jgi:hypothetical protein
MVRLLQPWQVNIGNRLIKQPQLYLRNSGLLHVLLAIRSPRDLARAQQAGRFVGRTHARSRRPGDRPAQRSTGLLGTAQQCRGGSVLAGARPELGGRGQVRGRSPFHPVHGQRRDEFGAGSSLGGVSRRPGVSAGRGRQHPAPHRDRPLLALRVRGVWVSLWDANCA